MRVVTKPKTIHGKSVQELRAYTTGKRPLAGLPRKELEAIALWAMEMEIVERDRAHPNPPTRIWPLVKCAA